ncbi:MAG: hypothetical protein OEL19_06540, partial [Sulfurimonas sp.]|nr:hypothetical protein [Sulfurimonas sp.]
DSVYTFPSNIIKVDETSEDGVGEINIDISAYVSTEIFFIKINHLANHAIGEQKNHNDGIVLKVDLEAAEIGVYLFELKKQLRFNKLEKASKQLMSAYRFIKYMQLEECFNINYKFHTASEINNLSMDSDAIKNFSRYQKGLFDAVYKSKNKIPLLAAFCDYQEYDFQHVNFGNTITI